MADLKIPFDIEKTVFLIDGSSFLYRAFYSMPPMHTKSGIPVSAVFGFCRMLRKLLKEYKPTHIAVAWDTYREGADARVQMYEAYKATRQAPPAELRDQKKLVQEFASIIGLCQVIVPGVEADDLMASLAIDYSREGFNVILVTPDKDMGQLVHQAVLLLDPFKDIIYDTQALEKRYGVPLDKIVYYFALIGDASDNIPGVKGIGPKTAQELVNQFDSLEDMYAHLERIARPRTRELLEASRDNAFLSFDLFKARYLELSLPAASCLFQAENWFKAREFFKTLNFSSLLKEFPIEALESEAQRAIHQELDAHFVMINKVDDLISLCSQIRAAGAIGLDTETDSLNSLTATCVGISLCVQKGTAYYIPLKHVSEQEQLSADVVRHYLKPILEDASIKKYLHHAKFDLRVLHAFGIEVAGVSFDTLIAAHLVSKDWQNLGLKDVSEFYLHQPMLTFDEMVTKKKLKNFSYVPLDRATEYAAADAHQTLALVDVLQKELDSYEQSDLFTTMEMPLVDVLYRMEREGIILDMQVIEHLEKATHESLNRLESEIKKMLPDSCQEINLNSPKQLENLFFTVLQLPPVKKTGQKTGYSTDVEVLHELAKLHPVPGLIIKYRELYKVYSTYIDALPDYVNKNTGRIHTSFNQTKTATGRLASTEPNLQNIPTGMVMGSVSIRSAFKAPDNCVFLSADYSQIELRVLAYLSQDSELKNAFLHNKDIHAQTAMGLFGVVESEVTTAQRNLAKRINFSVIYGVSPFGLSKDLDIPYKEASLYIDRYFAQYPGVVEWMDLVVDETKTQGYVTTLWGRRRYVPGIYERNRNLYELARRVAINTKVQGTAAELMKLGMLALDRILREKNLNSRLVLQIHDEVVLAVPQHELSLVEPLVQETLQTIVDWNVPLIVTTRAGATWQDITK